MQHDFDRLIARQGSQSLKWQKYAGRDILPLWVADMDFAAPPAVIEALRARVEHGIYGYTLPPPELVTVIADSLWRDYRWSIEPDWLVWLPGLVTGLNVACRAVGEPGSAVLSQTPVYPPFLSAPGLSGRRLVKVPLSLDKGRWQLDMDALEAAATEDCRLLLLCNPQNPTGRVFSRGELDQLAEFCLRHDLTVCSDEIHCDLILDPVCRHRPLAGLDDAIAARTITLMAPSKTYNLPGLGCSFAIISDPSLRRRFQRVMEGIVPHVTLFGYAGALAAYRDSGPWLTDLLAYLRENRRRVTGAVAAMEDLEMTPVEATYLAWIDARLLPVTDPAAFFEQAGVGLSDGADFGTPGFVRLNFGCPRSRLDAALERMVKALS